MIRDLGQLQDVVAVRALDWLRNFPEDTEIVGSTPWVIVAGSRRWYAGQEAGLKNLGFVERAHLAESPWTLLKAAVTENTGHEKLNPLDEAGVFEEMIAKLGSSVKVAEVVGKSQTYVAQYQSLTRLSPALKDLVYEEVIPFRLARDLVRGGATHDEQWTAWLAVRARYQEVPDSAEGTKPESEAEGLRAGKPQQRAPRPVNVVKLFEKLGDTPKEIAERIAASGVDRAQLRELVEHLSAELDSAQQAGQAETRAEAVA